MRRAPWILLLLSGLCLLGGCWSAGSSERKPQRPHVHTNLRPPATPSHHGQGPGHLRPPSSSPLSSFGSSGGSLGSTSYHGSRSPGSVTSYHGSRSPGSATSYHGSRSPGSATSYHGSRSPGSATSYHGSRSPTSASSSWLRAQPGNKSPSHLSRPPLTAATTSKAAATTPGTPPCDCDCYKRPTKLVCGVDPRTRERETFLNECQLECYNCTMKKRYKVVAHVACEEHKER